MSEPTMDEVLVKKLREWAGIYEGEEQGQLMALAADRIEALSERADIQTVEQAAEALAGVVIHICRGEVRIECPGGEAGK